MEKLFVHPLMCLDDLSDTMCVPPSLSTAQVRTEFKSRAVRGVFEMQNGVKNTDTLPRLCLAGPYQTQRRLHWTGAAAVCC